MRCVPRPTPDMCQLEDSVGGFEVELIDQENLIYEIRNTGASSALSNWIIELDACEFKNCLVSEVFRIGDSPPDMFMQGVCQYPSQNNEMFACPEGDAPCDGVITGLKFDELDDFGELSEGFAQRFQIILGSDFELAPACFQLKFGNEGRCGQICAPVCVDDECEDACECATPSVFQCSIDLPSCFSFEGTADDVMAGFCIGEDSCEHVGTCETLTTVAVCDQELECCVRVNEWVQSVDLEIIFNVPLTPSEDACGDTPITASCLVDDTFTKQCFSCLDDFTPPCTPPTCDNVIINPTETIVDTDPTTGQSTLTILFTVDLPDCSTQNG